MRTIELDRERGQALITVALMVVVLFGFLALALDVGNVYGGRRRMQNAADAGALAGARELCFGDPAQVTATAYSYAVDRNDAQDADVDLDGGMTVTVVASRTLNTFVAGLIGIQTADVRAEAAAVCGKVTSLCDLWPVAYDMDTFTKTVCGQHLLLWWGDGEADCETYSCTCSGGAAVPPSDGRTWIDFSAVMADGGEDPCDQSGCNARELNSRIVGSSDPNHPPNGEPCRSYIEIPSCAAAKEGVVSKAWQLAKSQRGKAKLIPLYDPDRSPCIMEHDPGNACGHLRWWIADVGCIEVVDACELKCKAGPPCPKARVIEVEVLCDDPRCNSACGTTIGGPPGPGDPRAVSLLH